jgi:tripartite-type tricarboxylate transporter receptor subunit TctC
VSQQLHVPIVLKNEPGANGVVGTQSAIHSAPDGYTLLATSTNLVTNNFLYTNLPFDASKELKGVARLSFVPMVMCVNEKFPANTIAGFVDYAKKHPGAINFGSAGKGSTGHLALVQLEARANVRITHVPYKGVNQAQQDLLGGQIDGSFIVPSAAASGMKTGKMKCLGVGAKTRVPQLPNVPTIAESGYPEFESIAWVGLVAPSATPDAVAQTVSDAFQKVMDDPQVKERIVGLGLTNAFMPYGEFKAYFANEFPAWGEFIKTNNIKIE